MPGGAGAAPAAGKVSVSAPSPSPRCRSAPGLPGLGPGSLPALGAGTGHRNFGTMSVENRDVLLDLEGEEEEEEEDDDNDDGEIGE